MLKLKKEVWILIAIFLLVFVSRLIFVFQTPAFSDDSAYITQRYTEYIVEEGKFLRYDPLSYGGRIVLYSPVLEYIFWFFGLFIPLSLVFKIIPQLFISSLVIIVYLIAKEVKDNEVLALIAALLSGFIPIIFIETLNTVSIYSLIIPLMFYLIYIMIKLERNNDFIFHFVVVSFIFAILHPSVFLLPIALIFYFMFMVSESLSVKTIKKEIMFFLMFLVLLSQFLIYKRAFLEHGFSIIWGNIPVNVVSSYFSKVNILDMIYKIGLLPIVFGFVGIVTGFYKKRENIFLLSGVIMSTLLLLWLRFIEPEIGLMFLGVALAVVSINGLDFFYNYLLKTKIKKVDMVFSFILVGGIFVFLIIPSFISAYGIIDNSQKDGDFSAMEWVRENTAEDATILGDVDEGGFISEYGKRGNVMDYNFLLAPDASKRFDDITTIYSTKTETKALELMKKYDIKYIYVSDKTIKKYGELVYLEDENCFKQMHKQPAVYKILC